MGLDRIPEVKILRAKIGTSSSQAGREPGCLKREQAQFGGLSLSVNASAQASAAFEQRQGQRLAGLQGRTATLQEARTLRRQTPEHTLFKDLPEKDRFSQLRPDKKPFVDTIKLIAYRAETAWMPIVREKRAQAVEARALVRDLLDSDVDLGPDS